MERFRQKLRLGPVMDGGPLFSCLVGLPVSSSCFFKKGCLSRPRTISPSLSVSSSLQYLRYQSARFVARFLKTAALRPLATRYARVSCTSTPTSSPRPSR